MRTPFRVLALLGVLLFSVPASARAEWHLTPFLGLTFKGDTTLVDHEQGADKTHWTFGGAVALMGGGPVGVEGLVVYTPGFFQQENMPPPDIVDSRTLAIMGNVVLTTPRSWNPYGLRPFVSGGIGLLQRHGNRLARAHAGQHQPARLQRRRRRRRFSQRSRRAAFRSPLLQQPQAERRSRDCDRARAPELLDGQRRRRAEVLTAQRAGDLPGQRLRRPATEATAPASGS